MSRYFETHRERLSNDYGWSTSAPSTYSGRSAGLGSYDRSGRGHPLNDQAGKSGDESGSAVRETTANYSPAGPAGKGYGSAGAHTVKASPGKARARFQS